MRVNIQRPILDFLHKRREQAKKAKPESQEPDIGITATSKNRYFDSTDEYGLLDHLEEAEESIKAAASAIGQINHLIEEIASESNRLTAEIEKNSAPNIPTSVRKKTVNDFAQFLKSKSVEIAESANIARQSYNNFAASFIMVVALQKESGDPDTHQAGLTQFLSQAEVTLSIIPESRSSMLGLRTAAQNLPRITIQFNQAKKQFVDALNDCLRVYDDAERGIFEITAKT